ncbi:MAG: prepilin-type N-terminal cleavage/methylation domain-containing protein [Verrucomicrobia bacterium]|nr:prepilin-type N-terminal cleavage/methylation domain-containing protein [Verrucomicrobiota bacterium]
MNLNAPVLDPSDVTPGPVVRARRSAFSLVELLIVMTLLSLIVLALMDVFSSTQRAFRASVTQTDILEGSRAAMELITSDLRRMSPSQDLSNRLDYPGYPGFSRYAVNFFVTNNDNNYVYQPLIQPLTGGGASRTNLLQWFFILSRDRNKWIGTGYAVNSASTSDIYPLYRFYGETNVSVDAAVLFNNFVSDVFRGCTNMSHIMDGVVHLVARPYDLNGVIMTNGYASGQSPPKNIWFSPPYPPVTGEVGFAMFNSALPASVELQMAVLEDQAVKRVASRGIPGQPVSPATASAQWSYLQSQSGRVHVFRQHVTIQNVDRSAYQ